jgi:hypothetical protein
VRETKVVNEYPVKIYALFRNPIPYISELAIALNYIIPKLNVVSAWFLKSTDWMF